MMTRSGEPKTRTVTVEEFIQARGGRLDDVSIYAQELNYTTWRLAKMNLAIRGIEGQIAHGDTVHNDRHPDLKADYHAETCARFIMATQQAERAP